MPMNLRQIMQRTPTLRKERAQYVKLTKMKYGHWQTGPDKGNAYVACSSYSTATVDAQGHIVPNRVQQRYVTVFTFIDEKLNVKASCSCGDMTYRWEWALWNRGAADIEYSDGSSPDETNPTYRPAFCKHGVALFERIKDKLPRV